MPITYRLAKGGPLTNAEMDGNLQAVEDLHDSAQAYEQNAAASVSNAAAAANFKGTWTDKTGAATMPASYSHLGKFWALAVNIPASPGIQTKTPGTAAEFVEIPISGLTAAQMHAATAKATPADADELPLIDSAASWAIKKLTWGALKTAVKAWLVAQLNTWTAPQTFAGGVVVSGGALGYGPGVGGTVTQATSKGTDVAINKPSGRITTHASTLAPGASAQFSVLNTSIGFFDVVVFTGFWGSTSWGGYRLEPVHKSTGLFVVRITNITTSALADVLQFDFVVLRGAAS